MGSLPILTNPTRLWQTPTNDCGSSLAVFSTNERPWKWWRDTFSANHKARFQDFKNFTKILDGVCHTGVVFVNIYLRRIRHATSVYRSPYLTNPTHVWQTPPHLTNPTEIWQTSPIYDNPPTYDKSLPDVTNQIGRSLSPGFVEYGPLYTTVQ